MKGITQCIQQACENGNIVAGFNIFGYEDAQAIIHAAERANAPVLLMINRDSSKIMDVEHWGALLSSLSQKASVPVGVHLDHCSDIHLIERAIHSGYTSVMYDGSKLPLEQNIENTAYVVQLASALDIAVEGEIGTVPYDDKGETEFQLTSPYEAQRLCKESGLSWLAVSVGNVHRLVGRKVHIDFDILKQIEDVCTVPIVIHGASGLYEEDIQKLRSTNVGKMNVGTALRKVFGESLRKEMQDNPNTFDRLELFKQPFINVEEKAYEIISSLCK